MGRYVRVVLAAVIIVTGVLVFLPSSPVLAGGMVLNQGFEQALGEEWSVTGSASRTCSGLVYEGSCAAQMTGADGILTQWVGNITPLGRYECWGWINASGTVTGVIELDFWKIVDGSFTKLSPSRILSASSTGGDYVQKTTSVRTPSETTHARIQLRSTGWTDGSVLRFDEIGFNPPAGGCFIATAAYGTETVGELDTLRDFRDQVLLDNALGSRFVATYYKVSPPIADLIADNDMLRAIIRETLINPVVSLLRWSQEVWKT